MSTLGLLPEDLVFIILSRLPVRTLMRFKCVSKYWNTLISTAEFARMHLSHSLLHSKPKYLICRAHGFGCHVCDYYFHGVTGRDKCLLSLHLYLVDDVSLTPNTNNSMMMMIAKKQELFLPSEVQGLTSCQKEVIGSCNGLLCFVVRPETYILCNPLTKSGRILPASSLQFGLGACCGLRCRRCPRRESYLHGFGYDDAHEDYKVIKISRDVPSASCHHVEVYSMKSDSWTRVPDLTNVQFDTKLIRSGVLVNCALHWLCLDGHILAFDLRTDEFRLFPAPELWGFHWWKQLSALNGCLCMAFLKGDRNDFWMMKDYDSKDSWTRIGIVRLSYVPMYPKPMLPIAHLDSKKLLVLYTGKKILWYDQVQKEVIFKVDAAQFPGTNLEGASEYFLFPNGLQFMASLVQPWAQGMGKNPSEYRKRILPCSSCGSKDLKRHKSR